MKKLKNGAIISPRLKKKWVGLGFVLPIFLILCLNSVIAVNWGSGGTVTTDGDYVIHTFTTNGTFVAGVGSKNVSFLIIGGGGSGGSIASNYGAGGGAGGFVNGSIILNSGSYPVVVGTGGPAVTSAVGINGANSSFNNSVAVGGGGGGGTTSEPGLNGGSGGGGKSPETGGTGGLSTQVSYGTAITGFGNVGGYGYSGGRGGGGGAGVKGEDTDGGDGNGGNGLCSTIYNGTLLCYAGGGGGGGASGSFGTGGLGGGGKGASTDWGSCATNGEAGVDGTGGGGGGEAGLNACASYKGGTGIVIIRYYQAPDSIPPNVQIVYPTNNTQYTSTTLHINYTTYDASGMSVCWYERDSNSTNITLTNCNTNITTETWSVGLHNVTVWGNDTLNNVNKSYINFSIKDTTAPTITFLFQNPSNLTTNNIYTSKLQINYTISDPSALGTVYYYSKTNETSSEIWQYINGTQTIQGYQGLTNRVGVNITNSTSTWNFLISSSLIYPSVFNLDPEVTGLVDKSYYNLTSYPQLLKVRFFNMTKNSYGTFNFMANATIGAGDLRIYFCNSSYVAGNIDISPYCVVMNNFPAVQGYNYSISPVSHYNMIPFNMNTTTNTLSGIKVSDIENYFVIRSTSGNWSVGYVTNISRPDTSQYSGNIGGAWSNLSGTANAFVSQYTPLNYTNYYYICANDTIGNYGCSAVRSNPIVEQLLAPTIPAVYSPIADAYSGNISINYTSSESSANISYYNITLVNLDLTLNKTIVNNSLNLGYIWNSSTAYDGNYSIRVEARDINGQYSYGYSLEFMIDNTGPEPEQGYTGGKLGGGGGSYKKGINNSFTNNATTNFTANVSDKIGISNITITVKNETGSTVNTTTISTGGVLKYVFGLPLVLIDGIYDWIVTAYDTLANFVTTTYMRLTVDTLLPSFTIFYPLNTTYSINVSMINYTVTELNDDSCWYSTNNGVTNSTPVVSGTNFTNVVSNEGSNNWIVYCNDSANNLNSSSVIFFKDTIFPSINITYPINNTNFSVNLININYTVNDTNLDKCWYSNDTYAVNTTLISCANITGVTWAEGKHNVTVWANDTSNNVNSSFVAFTVDSTSPSITINNPTALVDYGYTGKSEILNWTVVDASSDSGWYNYNGTNVTVYKTGGPSGGFPAGIIAYWDMSNTSATNIPDLTGNNHNITIVGTDGIPYQVNGLIGKAQKNTTSEGYMNVTGNLSGLQNLNRNFSIFMWINVSALPIPDGFASASYHTIFTSGSEGNWQLGFSTSGGTTPADFVFHNSSGVLTQPNTGVWRNDSLFHFYGLIINDTNATIYTDGVAVKTNTNLGALTSLSNATGLISFIAPAVNNSYVIDEVGIWNRSLTQDEITLLYNGGIGKTFDGSGSSIYSTPNNQTTFAITRTTNQNLTFYANDTFGNWNSKYVKWDYRIFENSQTYNTTTKESSKESFILNLTYNSTLWNGIIVNFNYNGTNYLATQTGTGNTLIFNKSNLVIPNVPVAGTNKNFFWNVSLTNGTETTYILTTPINQVINKLQAINITPLSCGAGFISAFNFTSLIESNLSEVNFTTVNYNLQYGFSGNSSALISSGTLTNLPSFNICINASSDYYVGYGEIQYQVTGYSARRFYIFQNTRLTNTTISNKLYSLESASSTPFQITATDTTLTAYVGYYVGLLRWYPNLNVYNLVDMGKTDELGQTVLNVKTNDIDYRLALYSPDGTLVKLLNPIRMVCQTTPCVYSLIVDLTGVDLTTFLKIQSNLTFDTTTKIFTYIFNDPSQDTTLMNLTVWQDFADRDSTVICSTTSNSFTGILTCDVSAYTGQIRAEVWRVGSSPILIAQLLEDIRQTLIDVANGKTIILFIGLILTVTMALMGVVSPPLVIILSIIALIPLIFLGLFSVALFILIGAIGGIILHMMRRIS